MMYTVYLYTVYLYTPKIVSVIVGIDVVNAVLVFVVVLGVLHLAANIASKKSLLG